jgi:hypothetical protein
MPGEVVATIYLVPEHPEQTGSATRNTQAAAMKNITINYKKISSIYQIINGYLV